MSLFRRLAANRAGTKRTSSQGLLRPISPKSVELCGSLLIGCIGCFYLGVSVITFTHCIHNIVKRHYSLRWIRDCS